MVSFPDHASNRKIKQNPEIYHYPHLDDNSLNDQSYLPDKIKDVTYYHPKSESSYEKALADRLKLIDKIKFKKEHKKISNVLSDKDTFGYFFVLNPIFNSILCLILFNQVKFQFPYDELLHHKLDQVMQ